MDLGCYPLHWMRSVAGAEPRVLNARAEQGARYAAYESGVRAGWLTPEEVRKAEGYALLGSSTQAQGPPGDMAATEPKAIEVNA